MHVWRIALVVDSAAFPEQTQRPVRAASIVCPAYIKAGTGHIVCGHFSYIHTIPHAPLRFKPPYRHQKTYRRRVGRHGVVVYPVVVLHPVRQPRQPDVVGVGFRQLVQIVPAPAVTHLPVQRVAVRCTQVSPSQLHRVVQHIKQLYVYYRTPGTTVVRLSHRQARHTKVACVGCAGIVVYPEVVLVVLQVKIGEAGRRLCHLTVLVQIARVGAPLDAPLVGTARVYPAQRYGVGAAHHTHHVANLGLEGVAGIDVYHISLLRGIGVAVERQESVSRIAHHLRGAPHSAIVGQLNCLSVAVVDAQPVAPRLDVIVHIHNQIRPLRRHQMVLSVAVGRIGAQSAWVHYSIVHSRIYRVYLHLAARHLAHRYRVVVGQHLVLAIIAELYYRYVDRILPLSHYHISRTILTRKVSVDVYRYRRTRSASSSARRTHRNPRPVGVSHPRRTVLVVGEYRHRIVHSVLVYVVVERLVAVQHTLGLYAHHRLTRSRIHRQWTQRKVAVAESAPTPVDVNSVESIIAVNHKSVTAAALIARKDYRPAGKQILLDAVQPLLCRHIVLIDAMQRRLEAEIVAQRILRRRKSRVAVRRHIRTAAAYSVSHLHRHSAVEHQLGLCPYLRTAAVAVQRIRHICPIIVRVAEIGTQRTVKLMRIAVRSLPRHRTLPISHHLPHRRRHTAGDHTSTSSRIVGTRIVI